MLRPRTRAAAVTGALALSLSMLSACGSDEAPESQPGLGLDSVTIEGKPGKELKVTYQGVLDPDESETKVLTEGDGATVKDGDTASIHWWAATGYQLPPRDEDGQTDESKLDEDGGYPAEPGYSNYAGAPEPVEITKEIFEPLREALIGQKVGSRVAVLDSAEDVFGEVGNPQLGVGNKDAVLFVVDIMDTAKTPEKVDPLDGPQGEDREPAGWAPEIIEKSGVPTGFDFSTGHKPSGELIATTLVKGDGPEVKQGQTITVNYLGQVYEGDKPFDESYSRGEPAEFPIGVGQVIDGWDERLVGRTVGSRLILEIPPAKGYGKAETLPAGIKRKDTLFFVVDILGAS